MAEAVDVMSLRKNLASLLDRANAGEEFEITKRGKTMARLGPPKVMRQHDQPPESREESLSAQRRRDALLRSINARGAKT